MLHNRARATPAARLSRVLLPSLLSLLCACAPAPAPAPPANPPAAVGPDPSLAGARSGTWVRAEGERKGKPMIWTYREDFVPGAARPKLLVVSMGVESATDAATMHHLQPELDQHEKNLREGLQGKAELVAVLDWDQQHDWYFYASPELSSDAVTALLGKASMANIQTTLEDDPEFAFYRTLQQRIGAKH
jgi:hypothetical protein